MAQVGDLAATNLAYRANTAGGIGFNNPATGDGRLVLPIFAGEVFTRTINTIFLNHWLNLVRFLLVLLWNSQLPDMST